METADRLACPICACADATVPVGYPADVPPWRDLVVVGCCRCGFAHVPVVPFSLEDYYRSRYGRSVARHRLPRPSRYFAEPYLSRYQERRLRRARRHRSLVMRHAARRDVVLDLGAGTGVLLHELEAGRKLAVEADRRCRRYLRHVGAEIVELHEVPDGSVDVVVASHFLEHLTAEQLLPTLGEVQRVLHAQGTVLVEVPGGAILSHDLSAAKHVPHTLFFTPESLELAVGQAGFDVVHVDAAAKVDPPPLDRPLYRPSRPEPKYGSGRGSLTVVGHPSSERAEGRPGSR